MVANNVVKTVNCMMFEYQICKIEIDNKWESGDRLILLDVVVRFSFNITIRL